MTLAFLFIECIKDQAENVKRVVRQMQGVSEAYSIANAPYDVVAKVETDDNERELMDTVVAIKHLTGISAVSTAIAFGNSAHQESALQHQFCR